MDEARRHHVSKISQTQRIYIVLFHLQEVPRTVKVMEIEENNGYKEQEGESKQELLFNKYVISVWDDEKLWTWIVGMVTQQNECIECHWNVHFETAKLIHFVMPILPQYENKQKTLYHASGKQKKTGVTVF